jgi:hypothetical protein
VLGVSRGITGGACEARAAADNEAGAIPLHVEAGIREAGKFEAEGTA